MNPLIANSLAFTKRILGRYYINHRVAKIRYGVAKGCLRRGGIGILGIFKKENEETNFLNKLDMHKYQVFYDIGCNFGAFSMFFAVKSQKDACIHAFDILSINCELAQDNFRLNKLSNIKTHHCGIGDTAGTFLIAYDPIDTATASIEPTLRSTILRNPHAIEEQVQVKTLDTLIFEQDLPKPDFVKIDVEGFEVSVLRGMHKTLCDKKPSLFIELHGATLKEKKAIASEVISILLSYNYKISHVEPNLEISAPNDTVWCGHLFCT